MGKKKCPKWLKLKEIGALSSLLENQVNGQKGELLCCHLHMGWTVRIVCDLHAKFQVI
jgi:hypothetical protein